MTLALSLMGNALVTKAYVRIAKLQGRAVLEATVTGQFTTVNAPGGRVLIRARVDLSEYEYAVPAGSSAAMAMADSSEALSTFDELTNRSTGDAGPLIACTGTAASGLFSAASHGLWPGAGVVFSSLTGGSGLTAGTRYFVINDGLTGDAFKVCTVPGQAQAQPFTFSTNLTAGFMKQTPDYVADYLAFRSPTRAYPQFASAAPFAR